MTKKRRFNWILFLKGIAMGAADVVPGVSGGTIAFITGIYDEFFESVKSINIKNLLLLMTFKIKAFRDATNSAFLLTLLLGIVVSIQSLARIITYALDSFPIPIWSFFFGLILASAIYVLKEVKQWSLIRYIGLFVGILVAASLTYITPMETPDALWFIFLCGMISITAMILPGISGSFILLLLGKYKYILIATKQLNLIVLGVFSVGMGVGLMIFSRILSWFLHRYYQFAIVLLSGFMLGSLNKIWPWKKINEGIMESNVLPHIYKSITGNDPQLFLAIVSSAVGYLIVYLIYKNMDAIAEVESH